MPIVTTHLIAAGATYTLAPNDGIIEFTTGTSGGTANMVAGYPGQRWVFDWLTGTTPPTINAPAGVNIQGYANPSVFSSSTTLTSPGDSYEVEFDGTQLIRVS